MKCDDCGRKFKRGNFVDGTPNGMTFVLEDKSITVCRGCMIKLGIRYDEQRE